MSKLVKQTKKSRITKTDTLITFMEYFVTILCGAIFLVVPLYMKHAFYEIGQCKFDVYHGITVVGLPLLGVLGIIYFIFEWKQLSLKEVLKSLSMGDWAVFCYLLFAIISFFLSSYKDRAWDGYSGWNMGLYAQISFVFLYFFASRCAKDYKVLLVLLYGASVIVIGLGVLNRFLIDPLGVYEGIAEHYFVQFLSTLGQSSWYSSFLCVVLPIGVYEFWTSKTKTGQIVAGSYVLLGFMSLVTQNSDSAYLAFAGMMFVFLWFSLDDWEKTRKFFIIIFLFGLATKVIQAMLLFADGSVIAQLDRLSLFLIHGYLSWIIMGVSLILIVAFTFLQKIRSYPSKAMRIARNILYSLFGVGVVVAVVLIVLSTKTTEAAAWSNIPYLTWNDDWGNGRGFTWKFSWQMFAEMNLKDKLFGVGPECYPYYAYEFYKNVVDAKWGGSVLTNAHNEWFNGMINYGLLGGITYLGIFMANLVETGKKAKTTPDMVMVIACVVSYMCHNFFCYQQVLCTPFIMIIMGMGQYIIRKSK